MEIEGQDTMTRKLLRIDASARRNGSITRDLNDRIVAKFESDGPMSIAHRDLAVALPQVTEDWIGANFTPAADRSESQKAALRLSDQLVGELKDADVILIGLPIYNFGVPAALKAWIDLVARVGETFSYGESGPVGQLEGKRAIVSVASGGTARGSEIDFATGYLRHVLGFIGIQDVVFVSADQMAMDADGSLEKAGADIASLDIAA